MQKGKYYLGLDIGTDSIGYAAADTDYGLLRYKGEQVWGVHLFEEASLNTERRAFRTARRRLDRRQRRDRRRGPDRRRQGGLRQHHRPLPVRR